jgi:hypothetical protein
MIWHNAREKFRMADILRPNLIRGYQNARQLYLPMEYVYMGFELTPVLFVRKEQFL